MAVAAAALAEGVTTISLSAERLANFIALCCVVAWRVTRLSMLSRDIAGAEPATTLTVAERPLLELATTEEKREMPLDLAHYAGAVARFEGYADRASDAPPGTTVIWRGFARLADFAVDARLATSLPGTCG